MKRVKGSERHPFFFISRFNVIQYDSYHADEVVMEITEDYVKRFNRDLLDVLETSILY